MTLFIVWTLSACSVGVGVGVGVGTGVRF